MTRHPGGHWLLNHERLLRKETLAAEPSPLAKESGKEWLLSYEILKAMFLSAEDEDEAMALWCRILSYHRKDHERWLLARLRP